MSTNLPHPSQALQSQSNEFNMQITWKDFRKAVWIARNELSIQGCIVISVPTENKIRFPLWHKARGLYGLLPVYNNDNHIPSDY